MEADLTKPAPRWKTTGETSNNGLSILEIVEAPFSGFKFNFERVGIGEGGVVRFSYNLHVPLNGELLSEETKRDLEDVLARILYDLVTSNEADEDPGDDEIDEPNNE